MSKPRLGLIGAGAAGVSLALGLYRQGYRFSGVASRTLASAEAAAARLGNCPVSQSVTDAASNADTVIIACPDDAIAAVCQQLAEQGAVRPGQLYLHLSGVLSSDELEAAKAAGADTLSMHPIQSFSDPETGADLLSGTYFCLEGEAESTRHGSQLVKALGGHVMILDKEQKSLYHTALSISSNYLIVIEYIAYKLLLKSGIESSDAIAAMLPLIEGSVANLKQSGLPNALTGPIARGDTETVTKHLNALRDMDPEWVSLYRELGKVAAQISQQKGQANHQGLSAILKQLNE